MYLRNFPLQNARPRGAVETRNYVNALSMKRGGEEVRTAVAARNQQYVDLDAAVDGVALDDSRFSIGSFERTRVLGVLSFDGSTEEGPGEVDYMRVDIVPQSKADRTLTFRKDGELDRYTRQYEDSGKVQHLVHDTQTDTINFFLRDDQGRFVSYSD